VVRIVFDEKNPDPRIQQSRFLVWFFFFILVAHNPPSPDESVAAVFQSVPTKVAWAKPGETFVH
jgi:hypothetical protein